MSFGIICLECRKYIEGCDCETPRASEDARNEDPIMTGAVLALRGGSSLFDVRHVTDRYPAYITTQLGALVRRQQKKTGGSK